MVGSIIWTWGGALLRIMLGEFGFGTNCRVGYGQMNKWPYLIKMTLQVGCICSAGGVVLL